LRRFVIISAAIVASTVYVQFFMSSVVKGLELTNLFFYMDVWPTMLAASGYAGAYLISKLFRLGLVRKHLTFPSLFFAATVTWYWHIPVNSFFGYGVCPADLTNPLLYPLRRISYFLVGVALFLSVRNISKPWREALAIAAGKIMGWYGLYLTLVDRPIYVAPPVIFSVNLHHQAGFAMLLAMLFLDFIAVTSLVNHYFKDRKPQPYPLMTEKL